MSKFKLIARVKEIYKNGGNIIQYLRKDGNRNYNTLEDILISYDFQAGSYVKSFFKDSSFRNIYSKAIAKVINNLGTHNSIIEIGVGEATTLANVLKHLNDKPKKILGFDISWSRLKFAKAFLKENQYEEVQLFTANLFEIPLKDNSVDIVYTSHSLEPNGGKEKEALEELYRIANKYVVLIEPSYELASPEAKERMEHHGYIKNLSLVAKELDYKIIEHRLFDHSVNPLNPSGLLVIEKEGSTVNSDPSLVCPISKNELVKHENSLLYSAESFLAYPIISQIPCLLVDNAILATHFLTDYEEFKTQID